MGTTLTGTTPQDTYDSLIKVTDNGPLTTSLKVLTDGLGNDSTLSLSQTAASIAGTLAVTGASTFSSAITMASGGSPRLTLQDTDAGAGNVGILFQESTSPKWTLASVGGDFLFFNEATASNAISVSSTNNVGIGTNAPAQKLVVESTTDTFIQVRNSTATQNLYIGATSTDARLTNDGATPITFNIDGAERIRILAGGGLTFNGDTAAANALDDYEEGTFTPTIVGSSSAGTATYAAANGRYTKIGRSVQFEIYISYSSGTGTGNLQIGGLPFTSANSSTYTAVSIGLFTNITLAAAGNVPFGYVENNATLLGFVEMPSGGGNNTVLPYDAAGGIQIAGTYSV